jgi:hypothetical protein
MPPCGAATSAAGLAAPAAGAAATGAAPGLGLLEALLVGLTGMAGASLGGWGTGCSAGGCGRMGATLPVYPGGCGRICLRSCQLLPVCKEEQGEVGKEPV